MTGTLSADDAMTPAEAAARLGISERTVQRRLKQGTLKGYKVKSGRGEVWRVMPDAVAPTPDAMTPQDDVVTTEAAAPDVPEVLELVRLVDRLQRDNQQLAGQLGFTQAKLQEAEHTIALLMAPTDEPQPAEVTPADPPRRSWWRRLLGAVR